MKITNHTDIKSLDDFEEKYIDSQANYYPYITNFIIDIYFLEQYKSLDRCNPNRLEEFKNSPMSFISQEGYIYPYVVEPHIQIDIIIDKTLCHELDFYEMEIVAGFAHELGHLIMTEGASEQATEINADYFAKRLGLQKELYSTIEKMEKSDKFNDSQKNSFKMRMLFLKD